MPRSLVPLCVGCLTLVACGTPPTTTDDDVGISDSTTSDDDSTTSDDDSTTSDDDSTTGDGDGDGDTSTDTDTTSDDGIKFDVGGMLDSDTTNCFTCSADLHTVLTCEGQVVEVCEGSEGCDAVLGTCTNACDAAENNKNSVGCEYMPTFLQHWDGPQSRCFAGFIANTWDTAANIDVFYQGQELPIENFARIPVGFGPNLSYDPYDPAQGLAPGEVLILFLSGSNVGQASCPIVSAIPSGVHYMGTGVADSFRVQSDVPVVAYQINPYGGGSAAVTGASLLLPTSAWDTNYVLINGLAASIGQPAANILAIEDDTTVTLDPVAAITGGPGIPATPANTPIQFVLDSGEHAQIVQANELTGSIIQSDKPIGLMGGHSGMQAPVGTAYSDHAEQMIPPVRALGHEYVGVMHRPRASEPGIWRVVGAIDDTQLTWEPDVGGPATLDQASKVEFITDQPFVVRSQDADHPFLLFNFMSGSTWVMGQPGLDGRGDSDYVISVPPDQYMPGYVFFADPTYPTTNLVLVRKRINGEFQPVTLDCAGAIGGWSTLGLDYEWTWFDLTSGNFQPNGNCEAGRHEIVSEGGRFGMWIWGWGEPGTTVFSQNVSYGYPAGMNVQPINDVVITPEG
jgi:hypothetical protein